MTLTPKDTSQKTVRGADGKPESVDSTDPRPALVMCATCQGAGSFGGFRGSPMEPFTMVCPGCNGDRWLDAGVAAPPDPRIGWGGAGGHHSVCRTCGRDCQCAPVDNGYGYRIHSCFEQSTDDPALIREIKEGAPYAVSVPEPASTPEPRKRRWWKRDQPRSIYPALVDRVVPVVLIVAAVWIALVFIALVLGAHCPR